MFELLTTNNGRRLKGYDTPTNIYHLEDVKKLAWKMQKFFCLLPIIENNILIAIF